MKTSTMVVTVLVLFITFISSVYGLRVMVGNYETEQSRTVIHSQDNFETKDDAPLVLIKKLEAQFEANIKSELTSGTLTEEEAGERRESIQFIY